MTGNFYVTATECAPEMGGAPRETPQLGQQRQAVVLSPYGFVDTAARRAALFAKLAGFVDGLLPI